MLFSNFIKKSLFIAIIFSALATSLQSQAGLGETWNSLKSFVSDNIKKEYVIGTAAASIVGFGLYKLGLKWYSNYLIKNKKDGQYIEHYNPYCDEDQLRELAERHQLPSQTIIDAYNNLATVEIIIIRDKHKEKNNIIGFAVLDIQEKKGAIGYWAVDECAKNAGLDRKLIKSARDRMTVHGTQTVIILNFRATPESNDSAQSKYERELYLGLGFEPSNEENVCFEYINNIERYSKERDEADVKAIAQENHILFGENVDRVIECVNLSYKDVENQPMHWTEVIHSNAGTVVGFITYSENYRVLYCAFTKEAKNNRLGKKLLWHVIDKLKIKIVNDRSPGLENKKIVCRVHAQDNYLGTLLTNEKFAKKAGRQNYVEYILQAQPVRTYEPISPHTVLPAFVK
jgi:ribosomal protein S18 acetylase RimI-like enzyme